MTLQDLIRAAQFFSDTALVVNESQFKENLATWDIAVDAQTGKLMQFDIETLQFYELSGLSDSLKVLTTKRPSKVALPA